MDFSDSLLDISEFFKGAELQTLPIPSDIHTGIFGLGKRAANML
jgi:hypothetical protein